MAGAANERSNQPIHEAGYHDEPAPKYVPVTNEKGVSSIDYEEGRNSVAYAQVLPPVEMADNTQIHELGHSRSRD
jgi:hypothetical protein